MHNYTQSLALTMESPFKTRLQGLKAGWVFLNRKQRSALLTVAALLLTLPATIGAVLTSQYINSRAFVPITPPITPPTVTPTPSPVVTPTPTPVVSVTPTPSPVVTPTPTPSPSPSPTPTPPYTSVQVLSNGSFELDSNNDRIPDLWHWLRGRPDSDEGRICNGATSDGACWLKIKSGLLPTTVAQKIRLDTSNTRTLVLSGKVWFEMTGFVKASGLSGVGESRINISFLKEGRKVASSTKSFAQGTYTSSFSHNGAVTKAFDTIEVSLVNSERRGFIGFDNLALTITTPQ